MNTARVESMPQPDAICADQPNYDPIVLCHEPLSAIEPDADPIAHRHVPMGSIDDDGFFEEFEEDLDAPETDVYFDDSAEAVELEQKIMDDAFARQAVRQRFKRSHSSKQSHDGTSDQRADARDVQYLTANEAVLRGARSLQAPAQSGRSNTKQEHEKLMNHMLSPGNCLKMSPFPQDQRTLTKLERAIRSASPQGKAKDNQDSDSATQPPSASTEVMIPDTHPLLAPIKAINKAPLDFSDFKSFRYSFYHRESPGLLSSFWSPAYPMPRRFHLIDSSLDQWRAFLDSRHNSKNWHRPLACGLFFADADTAKSIRATATLPFSQCPAFIRKQQYERSHLTAPIEFQVVKISSCVSTALSPPGSQRINSSGFLAVCAIALPPSHTLPMLTLDASADFYLNESHTHYILPLFLLELEERPQELKPATSNARDKLQAHAVDVARRVADRRRTQAQNRSQDACQRSPFAD